MTEADRLIYIDAVSTDAVEAIDVLCAPHKTLVVVFHPSSTAETEAVYSNAAAADLVPVLRALLARIEAGALRMPVAGGTVRWVELGEAAR